jgi:hypothetical protein
MNPFSRARIKFQRTIEECSAELASWMEPNAGFFVAFG